MAEAKFNVKNPAVKRILQEIKEMQNNSTGEIMAEALENDIFEWHFAMRGPPETEFEGGVYHGRILLPADYPFKPPAFMMLTPNGRFETNMKICLSISSHHPEQWQPSWSVRTALTALIAFMPTPGQGALGSLDYTKEERMRLAAKSRLEPPRFGSAERQKIVDDMHQRMLQAAPSTSTSQELPASPQPVNSTPADSNPSSQPQPASPVAPGPSPTTQQPQPATTQASSAPAPAPAPDTTSLPSPVLTKPSDAATTNPTSQSPLAPATPSKVPGPAVPQAGASQGSPVAAAHQQTVRPATHTAHPHDLGSDKGLTLLAVALTVCIAAILLRKVLVAFGVPIPGLQF